MVPLETDRLLLRMLPESDLDAGIDGQASVGLPDYPRGVGGAQQG